MQTVTQWPPAASLPAGQGRQQIYGCKSPFQVGVLMFVPAPAAAAVTTSLLSGGPVCCLIRIYNEGSTEQLKGGAGAGTLL